MPTNTPEPEIWRFACHRCEIGSLFRYPPRYRGNRIGICPGCEEQMEVVEQPKEEPEKDDVVVNTFIARRYLQTMIEDITNPPPTLPG